MWIWTQKRDMGRRLGLQIHLPFNYMIIKIMQMGETTEREVKVREHQH